MTVELSHPDVGGAVRRQRGGAGVIFASTIGNLLSVTPTVTAVFGVFLVAIATEFNWPRAEVGAAVGLVSIMNALAYPFAGRLADKYGSRPVILIGSAVMALLIISLAFAPANIFIFYAQFAAIGLIGAMPSSIIFAKLLSEWFDDKRGLWIGIAGGVGNGVGSTVLPMLAASLFVIWGWRVSFAGIGLLVLLVGFPILYLFIHDPKPVAALPNAAAADEASVYEGLEAKAAMKTPAFWLLATAIPIGSGCLIGLFSTLIPLLTDRSVSLDSAMMVLIIFALTTAIWEPTVGFILDRTRGPRILAPFYWVSAGGLILLLNTTNLPLLLLAGIMMGLGLGAESSALSYLLSRYFGRRALGTISGVAFGIMLAVSAIAIVLLNAAYDTFGDYRIAVEAIVPLLAWNGVALFFLGRYTYSVSDSA